MIHFLILKIHKKIKLNYYIIKIPNKKLKVEQNVISVNIIDIQQNNSVLKTIQ